jgi:hypothetical protein
MRALLSAELAKSWTAILMISSMAVLMRSFLLIKVCLVAMFMFAAGFEIVLRRRQLHIHQRLLFFYLPLSLAGVIWAIIGLIRHVNYSEGAIDGFKLYGLWSLVFLALFSVLRSGDAFRSLHYALVLAGILIPLVNFIGIYNLDLMPNSFRTEMALDVGVGNGYLQLGSSNIISMFVVAPYLLTLQFRSDAGRYNSKLTKLALFLSLTLTALSGRRALWVVIAVMPCLVLVQSWITGTARAIRPRVLVGAGVISIVLLSAVLLGPRMGFEVGSADRLQQAFSGEDERTVQAPYLLAGFERYPLFGSGFGGYAGYTRSDVHPWSYELTYHTMLFNMGVVGVAFIVSIFVLYFWIAIRLLRKFKEGSAVPFALLISVVSLLIGAYSNPYLGGFDSLFFVGLLPYITTFRNGFNAS